jgi:hypothetical protein
MSEPSISADYDMMMAALAVVPELYPKAKNVLYMNKELYKNVAVMNDNLLKVYEKRCDYIGNLEVRASYYFLSSNSPRIVKHGPYQVFSISETKPIAQYNYYRGKRHGPFYVNYEKNGMHYEGPKIRGTYCNDQLHGEYVKYSAPKRNQPSVPLVEENYFYGILHGKRVIRCERTREVNLVQHYVLGKLHGLCLTYYNDVFRPGRYLIAEENYKNGVKHGECIYYRRPKNMCDVYSLRKVQNFYNGEPHGVFTKYKLGKYFSEPTYNFIERPEIDRGINNYAIGEIESQEHWHYGKMLTNEGSHV